MVRGQPDYGMYAPTRYMAGMSDMAELAVRLGSIVIFDRRGRVAFLDDFEATVLKWNPVTAAGATVALDSTDPKSGAQDVKLSLANLVNSDARIEKGFIRLPSNRLGIEVSFARPDTNSYFYTELHVFDGTNVHIASIRLDVNAGDLACVTTGGVYTNFATGLSVSTDNFVHHPIKMVSDFSIDKYVRCIYGDTEYDLSAYDLWVLGNATPPRMLARFDLYYRVQAVQSIYLDDAILTQDEP